MPGLLICVHWEVINGCFCKPWHLWKCVILQQKTNPPMIAAWYKELSRNTGISIARFWAFSKNHPRIFKPMISLFLEMLWNFLFLFVSIVQKRPPLQKDTSICLGIYACNMYYMSPVYVPGTRVGIWRWNLTEAWPFHTRSLRRRESRSLRVVWILKFEGYSWWHGAQEAGSICLSESATGRSLALGPVDS